MKFWARNGERFAIEDVHWYGANGPVDFASRTVAYCLHGANDRSDDQCVLGTRAISHSRR